MDKPITIKYWEKRGHILIESNNWDCFLLNESLNPMINWLNLYRKEIELGNPCSGSDRINEVDYHSVGGTLMIRTSRDVVFLSKLQLKELVLWLNMHKEILGIREIYGSEL